MGTLDAALYENEFAVPDITGSLGTTILTRARRVTEQFGTIDVVYRVERGAIIPVFQATTCSERQKVQVLFDNLEIYTFSHPLSIE